MFKANPKSAKLTGFKALSTIFAASVIANSIKGAIFV